MINLRTKFEVSRCTRYEAMNGGAKCRKWGGLGWLAGTGQSRSWAMLPFDRARTTSYSTLVETMRLSCIVFEIERSICRKSPILTHPPAFGGPVRFDSGRMSLRSLAPENWSPWVIVLCCLRDP